MTDQMTVRPFRESGCIPAPDTARWGPWRLDREKRVLWTTAGRQRLAVDLDPLTTAAAILDAVITVSRAAGGDDAVTAGFVAALDDVLRPLRSVSSWGRPRRLTRREIRDLVSGAGELRDTEDDPGDHAGAAPERNQP